MKNAEVQNAAQTDWMVIGYSKMEGEYPIRMRVTQEEATQIANELNSGKPKYPVVARCMTDINENQ